MSGTQMKLHTVGIFLTLGPFCSPTEVGTQTLER